MPTPDPSAALTPWQSWVVDTTGYGAQLAVGLGVELAIIGIVLVFLMSILAVNVYRP